MYGEPGRSSSIISGSRRLKPRSAKATQTPPTVALQPRLPSAGGTTSVPYDASAPLEVLRPWRTLNGGL
jgi:hypothetical protein